MRKIVNSSKVGFIAQIIGYGLGTIFFLLFFAQLFKGNLITAIWLLAFTALFPYIYMKGAQAATTVPAGYWGVLAFRGKYLNNYLFQEGQGWVPPWIFTITAVDCRDTEEIFNEEKVALGDRGSVDITQQIVVAVYDPITFLRSNGPEARNIVLGHARSALTAVFGDRTLYAVENKHNPKSRNNVLAVLEKLNGLINDKILEMTKEGTVEGRKATVYFREYGLVIKKSIIDGGRVSDPELRKLITAELREVFQTSAEEKESAGIVAMATAIMNASADNTVTLADALGFIERRRGDVKKTVTEYTLSGDNAAVVALLEAFKNFTAGKGGKAKP